MIYFDYIFIYKTTNLINGKIYVGQHSTDNLDDGYIGSGKFLRKAIKKYGREHFKREILEFCTVDNVDEKESFYIQKENCLSPIGYNLITTSKPILRGEENGMYGANPWNKGLKGAQEAWNKGKNMTESQTYLMKKNHADFNGKNNPFFRKSHNESTKKYLSEINSGDKNPMFGKVPHNKGKKHTNETKDKMKEAYNRRPLITCPYCGYVSKHIQNMNRYHLENCKYKKIG